MTAWASKGMRGIASSPNPAAGMHPVPMDPEEIAAAKRAGPETGDNSPGGAPPAPEEILLLSQVSILPVLVNTDEVARLMLASHPRELLGTGGRVVAEFVVDSAGRVDATTIRIREGGPSAFAGAAFRVAGSLRFLPARVEGRAVAVWVAFPLEWNAE